MPFYIFIAVLIVIVAILSIVIDRNLRIRKLEANLNTETTEASGESSTLTSGLEDVRDRITGKKRKELPKRYQVWAAKNIKDNALNEWVAGLSDEELEPLVFSLAKFVSQQGIDLTWLTDSKLDTDPEIKKSVETIAISYNSAYRDAQLAQDNVTLFKAIQGLEGLPSSRSNQALAQQLYAELVKQELAPATSPEMLLANDSERREHIQATIQNVAQKDREAFKRVLKEVLTATKDGKGEEELNSSWKALNIFKRNDKSTEAEVVSH